MARVMCHVRTSRNLRCHISNLVRVVPITCVMCAQAHDTNQNLELEWNLRLVHIGRKMLLPHQSNLAMLGTSRLCHVCTGTKQKSNS
jgi:hypothetical protein